MKAGRRRSFAIALMLLAAASVARTSEVAPPTSSQSVRFAVIGDSGTGSREQYEVAARMAEARSVFPFEFVLMLGDNMYGSQRPEDYVRKFERPYAPLLEANVEFRASLGNHDEPEQRFYERFNMNGERYYTFTKGPVRFFALDSTAMDRAQLDWLERELKGANEPWTIAFFHHPLYSSGARHGASEDLRAELEPLFVKYGVDVVFSGHEHFYERMKPQQGITYFTNGGAAKLRKGNIRPTSITAAGLDTDRSFMLVEIAGGVMHFQTIARTGSRADAGEVRPAPSRETLTP